MTKKLLPSKPLPEIIPEPILEIEQEEISLPIEEVEIVTPKYEYSPIGTAPRNGTLIIVSGTQEDKGEIAFWKKTRAFANATHRWEETGFFVSNITNLRLSFTPKFWRIKNIYEI